MVMVTVYLVCKRVVVVVLQLVAVVACIDLSSLLVCTVVVVMDVVVLQLVRCTSIFVVVEIVVVVVVVVFLDCGGFSLLYADLFCFVDCCFFVVGFVGVAWLALVLRLVGLVV